MDARPWQLMRGREKHLALPVGLRWALYPVSWLYHTAVGDALHHGLHWCSEWGKGREGIGPGLIRFLGYIHTCHHRYLDAFGTVNIQFQWHNLVLDKIVKRALHQLLALGTWAGLACCTPRWLAASAVRSMVEIAALDMLRTVWFVMQTLPRGRDGSGLTAAERQSAQWRKADHPSLCDLPPDAMHRLRRAMKQHDGSELLRLGFWITPEAHALHHFNWRNFASQYIHWGALCVLLRWTHWRRQDGQRSKGIFLEFPPEHKLGHFEAISQARAEPDVFATNCDTGTEAVLLSTDERVADTPRQVEETVPAELDQLPLLDLGPELLLCVLTAGPDAATSNCSILGAAELAKLERVCRVFLYDTHDDSGTAAEGCGSSEVNHAAGLVEEAARIIVSRRCEASNVIVTAI